MTPPAADPARDAIRLRHLRAGWWGLAFYLALGLVLEVFHGFKVPWYLDVAHTSRRELLTLGHAHGTLVAVINVVFAALLPSLAAPRLRLVSALLLVALLFLPFGFLLGGLFATEGDPGLPIVLVPLGALALLLGVIVTASGTRKLP